LPVPDCPDLSPKLPLSPGKLLHYYCKITTRNDLFAAPFYRLPVHCQYQMRFYFTAKRGFLNAGHIGAIAPSALESAPRSRGRGRERETCFLRSVAEGESRRPSCRGVTQVSPRQEKNRPRPPMSGEGGDRRLSGAPHRKPATRCVSAKQGLSGSGQRKSVKDVTGWRAGGATCTLLLASGMTARKTGAAFAYRSKGHGRPCRGWRVPCPFFLKKGFTSRRPCRC